MQRSRWPEKTDRPGLKPAPDAPTLQGMKNQRTAQPPAERWTRPDEYVEAMAFKRTARRKRAPKGRTQPESPRLLLSTLPFLALIGLLAILAVAIMVIAFPGSQPQQRAAGTPERHQGVAQKGWFQEAQKEFHH